MPLRTALLLACLASLGLPRSVAATDAFPAAPPAAVRKAVRQYALVSANDFQQRDPQDWRLLASNDGGETWVTLDKRTGETFTDRHQRRVFQLVNTNAYNLYRLRIDRVRDASANSVQLAEIELMGETPDNLDPVPIFSDTVTAQGDHPPLESVARLFDRQVETKWLDQPADRINCSSWIQWRYQSPGNAAVTNLNQLLGLQTRAGAGYRVQIEGVVTDRRSGNNSLEILDDTGALEIAGGNGAEKYLPGQRVLVEGLSQWTERRVGIGQLQIALRSGSVADAPARISAEQPLRPDQDFQWVDLEGNMQFQRRAGDEVLFDLQDGESSVPVRLRDPGLPDSLPRTGSRVRARGICRGGFNGRGDWVPVSLWASRVEELKDPRKGDAAAEATTSRSKNASGFTSIRRIRQMGRKQLESRPQVKVRGVITGLLGMYVQDDTAAIQVVFYPSAGHNITMLGAYVEFEGQAGLSDAGTPLVSANRILLLTNGALPAPQRPSWGQLVTGTMDSQWIEMDGAVRATDGAHLLLNCDGRQVTASINAAPVPVVKQLVDAAVRVRGVGLAALDDWGRVQGVHLLIPSLEYVEVQQAPQEPFSQPIRPIRDILRLSRPEESLHQVRIEGVLTLQDQRKLFLQDATGSAMAIFKEEIVLDPRFGRSRWSFWRAPTTNAPLSQSMKFSSGDRVQVVGFRDTHGYSPILTEVSVRKVGTGTAHIQTVNGDSFTEWKLDSALVQLEAVLLGRETLGSQTVLELLSHGRTLQALMPAGEVPDAIANGTRLRVTGVWQMDPVPYAELGRRVASVRILPRSMKDLVVLSRPSWWTVEHALTVIGGMAFVLFAASIWIRQLHRKVEQRSLQLTAEIHRREQIERQRALQEERARIAQDLHDDLGATLTQIRFLSAIESRDATVPEGTRRRLGQVSEKSHHLVSSLDEIVWAINPANDSLPNLANYLSHVAEEFFSTTPIRCRLDVDESLPAVPLTSEVRHNLYLAVREALNNIAKHSQATEVWLQFLWRENALHIAIEDNGRSFDEANVASSGEGMANMRRRLEKIGGRFELVARPGLGTVCRIRLPLKQPER